MSRPEHRHDDDRTGNGIVNHGPEMFPGSADPDEATDESADPARTTGAGATPTEFLAGGGRGPAARVRGGVAPVSTDAYQDIDPDGIALRLMLRDAVQDLVPSEGTLDRLHRAVPARRARRRQAVVGSVAAALLIGTAVPAFIHVAGSDGPSTASPAIAGHGEQAHGGNGDEAGAEVDTEQPTGPAEEQNEGSEGEPDSSTAPTRGAGSDPEGEWTGGVADSPASEAAVLPACDPGQLAVAAAESGEADTDGRVYGTFRIANVSGKGCSVSSDGKVGFHAVGAADPLKITVVQHTAGDAAAGLPDPSLEPGTVLLKPAMAYEVRFAWVPTDTCPAAGASPSPTPSDAAGGGSTGTGTAGEGQGAQFTADDGPAEGGVAVTHTPEAGAPTAETDPIPNACAGTIYRTGVLEAS